METRIINPTVLFNQALNNQDYSYMTLCMHLFQNQLSKAQIKKIMDKLTRIIISTTNDVQHKSMARCILGYCHENGIGCEKNVDLARGLYKQAIEINANNEHALYQLGLMQYYGIGEKRDVEAGKKNLEDAAKKGSVDALLPLANRLLNTKTKNPTKSYDFVKDYARGIEHYQKAAEKSPIAMYYLAELHNNYGNNEKSIERLTQASNAEYFPAKTSLAAWYLAGYLKGRNDKSKIIEILKECIDANDPEAMYLRAKMHINDGNYTSAKYLLEKAGRLDHTKALYELGTIYRDNKYKEITRDENREEKAIEYYRKAKLAGNQDAIFDLAKLYIKKGDLDNYREAARLYYDAVGERISLNDDSKKQVNFLLKQSRKLKDADMEYMLNVTLNKVKPSEKQGVNRQLISYLKYRKEEINKQALSADFTEDDKQESLKLIDYLISGIDSGICFSYSLLDSVFSYFEIDDEIQDCFVQISHWDEKLESLEKTVTIKNSKITIRNCLEKIINFAVPLYGTSKQEFEEFSLLNACQENILNPEPDRNNKHDKPFFEIIIKDQPQYIKERHPISGNLTDEQLSFLLEHSKNIVFSIYADYHAMNVEFKNNKWIFYDPNFDHKTKKTMVKTFSNDEIGKRELIKIIRARAKGKSIVIDTASFKENSYKNSLFETFYTDLTPHQANMLIQSNGFHHIAKYNPDKVLTVLNTANKLPSAKLTSIPIAFSDIDSEGWTPLHAIAKYAPEALSDVLKIISQTEEGKKAIAAALVYPTNKDGWTCLHFLARHAPKTLLDVLKIISQTEEGKKAIADALLHPNKDGWTCLHFLAKHAPKTLLDVLKIISQTEEGKKAIADALLHPNKDGWTCLHFLAKHAPKTLLDVLKIISQTEEGKKAIVAALLHPNKNGWTCLHFLARHAPKTLLDVLKIISQTEEGKKAIVAALLHPNKNGWTCFPYMARYAPSAFFAALEIIYATQSNSSDLIKNLCKSSNKNDDLLLNATIGGDIKIVRWVLENGANPNSVNEENYTSLFAAANNGDFASVQLLITYGADVNVPVHCTVEAIRRCLENNKIKEKMNEFLSTSQQNIDTSSNTILMTPIDVARIYGYKEIELFLQGIQNKKNADAKKLKESYFPDFLSSVFSSVNRGSTFLFDLVTSKNQRSNISELNVLENFKNDFIQLENKNNIKKEINATRHDITISSVATFFKPSKKVTVEENVTEDNDQAMNGLLQANH